MTRIESRQFGLFTELGRRLALRGAKRPGKLVAGAEPRLLGNDGDGKGRRPEQATALLKLALTDDVARRLASRGLGMFLESPS